jgi:hypothetical protein
MAAAIEECGTHEVLDRNDAIEALKKEIEVLEAEKTLVVVIGCWFECCSH